MEPLKLNKEQASIVEKFIKEHGEDLNREGVIVELLQPDDDQSTLIIRRKRQEEYKGFLN